MSEIKEYSRTGGFTIVQTEFAQSTELSLEAKGLLTELTSHSKQYKIYKTQLYHRSKYNSRHKIDKAWKELEAKRYLLAFKQNNVKGFIFEYLFSTQQFSTDEVKKLIRDYDDIGYSLHTKHVDYKALIEENLTLLNISNVKNPIKSTFPTLLNISSVNTTVLNQHLINTNKINTNKINRTESDESVNNSKHITESSHADLKTTLKQFKEKQDNQKIEHLFQNSVHTNDTAYVQSIEHNVLHTYQGIIPEVILVLILQFIGNDLTQCEMIIQNILKSKQHVAKQLQYAIFYEELSDNQLQSLQHKIKHIIFRLNKPEFIERYGKVTNPEAFCFTVLKNFFLEEYEAIAMPVDTINVPNDTATILLHDWIKDSHKNE